MDKPELEKLYHGEIEDSKGRDSLRQVVLELSADEQSYIEAQCKAAPYDVEAADEELDNVRRLLEDVKAQIQNPPPAPDLDPPVGFFAHMYDFQHRVRTWLSQALLNFLGDPLENEIDKRVVMALDREYVCEQERILCGDGDTTKSQGAIKAGYTKAVPFTTGGNR